MIERTFPTHTLPRPATPGWWLTRQVWDRKALVTWRHPIWWIMLRFDLEMVPKRAYYNARLWMGLWELKEEGGFHFEGHWTRPWKNPNAGYRWAYKRMKSRLPKVTLRV